MSRFTDNVVSWGEGEPGPPIIFVSSLLMELGKTNSARGEQEAAIASWLSDHEPTDLLVEDLQAKGFGHLLRPRTAA